MRFTARLPLARLSLLISCSTLVAAVAQGQNAVQQILSQTKDSSVIRTALDSLLTPRTDLATRSEASYWRAEYAESATEREKGLTSFVVDFPFSPHMAPALFELGNLELGHADLDRASLHLTQFLAVSPPDSDRATASLALARILFDKGEAGRACAVALNGRAELPSTAVEMRNQFDFLASPCAAVDTSSAPKPVKPEPPPADTGPRSALGEYTVQVAAYDTRPQADRLATRLRGAGYEARVIGTKKPFRVRVGHYTTHSGADAVSRKIEALVKLKPFVLLIGPEDM